VIPTIADGVEEGGFIVPTEADGTEEEGGSVVPNMANGIEEEGGFVAPKKANDTEEEGGFVVPTEEDDAEEWDEGGSIHRTTLKNKDRGRQALKKNGNWTGVDRSAAPAVASLMENQRKDKPGCSWGKGKGKAGSRTCASPGLGRVKAKAEMKVEAADWELARALQEETDMQSASSLAG
ncbi:unnamed protein product, partial [Choristocarpus tenellus]